MILPSCNEQLGQSRSQRRGNTGVSVLTYIIEKGKYCQPIWLISGFSEACVLVGIVMDNMELKDKVEIHNIKCQITPKDLLFKWKTHLTSKNTHLNCVQI